MNEAGKVLARMRLPEGVAGIAGLHEMIGRHLGEDADEAEVAVGIETDRGPWVAALTRLTSDRCRSRLTTPKRTTGSSE